MKNIGGRLVRIETLLALRTPGPSPVVVARPASGEDWDAAVDAAWEALRPGQRLAILPRKSVSAEAWLAEARNREAEL
jgi:hypothetical protein